MLSVDGVAGGYPGHPVLLGIDIALAEGARTAILGRNGVGKTTLIKTIAGLLAPSGGRIRLDDVDLTRVPAHERVRLGIAHVPQGRDIFVGLTVFENLKVAAVAQSRHDWRQRVDEILDQFPALAGRTRAAGESLSGGQQQVLALARSLVTRPRVLLLDEPSEGIQPSILDELADLILTVNRQRGVTVVIAEQNLEFAAKIADRALVMEKGRISVELPIAELAHARDLQRKYLAI